MRQQGGTPRGSQLLDGVSFSSDLGTTTFERSREFDVDHVSDTELRTIADTVRSRFGQESVLTFDYLPPGDDEVDAIVLEVPGVTAQALRDGLLADQAARERLFGGSVTPDGYLLLIAELADAQLARTFAARVGGDPRAPRPVTASASSSRRRRRSRRTRDGLWRSEDRAAPDSGAPEEAGISYTSKPRASLDISMEHSYKLSPIAYAAPSGRKEQVMILVTGATGNAGSEVVRALTARGERVRAFVRDPQQAGERLGDGVELAVGDFADRRSVRAALEGVDGVVLSCADDPRRVAWETSAIDAAAAGVRRIVKLSAVGAAPDSPVASGIGTTASSGT